VTDRSRIVCVDIHLPTAAEPDRWASVEVCVWPEEPARTWGRPDDWHPGEPGAVEPLSVLLSWDEEPERVETVTEAADVETLLGDRWEEVEKLAQRAVERGA